jgi:hypothetical protein
MDEQVRTETFRKFGPKPEDRIHIKCAACREGFVKGDYTTLINIGPGDDPDEREKCLQGRPYTAVAVEAHWACVTGEAEFL